MRYDTLPNIKQKFNSQVNCLKRKISKRKQPDFINTKYKYK